MFIEKAVVASWKITYAAHAATQPTGEHNMTTRYIAIAVDEDGVEHLIVHEAAYDSCGFHLFYGSIIGHMILRDTGRSPIEPAFDNEFNSYFIGGKVNSIEYRYDDQPNVRGWDIQPNWSIIPDIYHDY